MRGLQPPCVATSIGRYAVQIAHGMHTVSGGGGAPAGQRDGERRDGAAAGVARAACGAACAIKTVLFFKNSFFSGFLQTMRRTVSFALCVILGLAAAAPQPSFLFMLGLCHSRTFHCPGSPGRRLQYMYMSKYLDHQLNVHTRYGGIRWVRLCCGSAECTR